ncbi:3'-5' exonuclease [Rhodopseudomonas palustris]
MDDVMIDIETLSTHPFNAVVLSIGAVDFQLGAGGKPGEPLIGERFSAILDIRSQLIAGRVVDRDTQKWWRERCSSAAQDVWVRPDRMAITHPMAALRELAIFLGNVDAKRIWAHGAVFDIGNLESLCREYEVPVPWRYDAIRDCRTIVRELPPLLSNQDSGERITHVDVDDCISQIFYLSNHMPTQAAWPAE